MREIVYFKFWGFALFVGWDAAAPGLSFERRSREIWAGKLYAVWDLPRDAPARIER